MPAECTCGVIAVGRCGSCDRAFCSSHSGGVDVCRECYVALQRCLTCSRHTETKCGSCDSYTCPEHTAGKIQDCRDANTGRLFTMEIRICERCQERERQEAAAQPEPRLRRAVQALVQAGSPGSVEDVLVGIETYRRFGLERRRQLEVPVGRVWPVGEVRVRNPNYGSSDDRYTGYDSGPEFRSREVVVTEKGRVRQPFYSFSDNASFGSDTDGEIRRYKGYDFIHDVVDLRVVVDRL